MRAGDTDGEVWIVAAPFSLAWVAGAFPSANESTSDVLYSGAMHIGNRQSEIETQSAVLGSDDDGEVPKAERDGSAER